MGRGIGLKSADDHDSDAPRPVVGRSPARHARPRRLSEQCRSRSPDHHRAAEGPGRLHRVGGTIRCRCLRQAADDLPVAAQRPSDRGCDRHHLPDPDPHRRRRRRQIFGAHQQCGGVGHQQRGDRQGQRSAGFDDATGQCFGGSGCFGLLHRRRHRRGAHLPMVARRSPHRRCQCRHLHDLRDHRRRRRRGVPCLCAEPGGFCGQQPCHPDGHRHSGRGGSAGRSDGRGRRARDLRRQGDRREPPLPVAA